jgi:4'-phosphopantetheinyl transferase
MVATAAEIHVWQARLDAAHWPSSDGLPPKERDREARIQRREPRRRWVAARWALRGILGAYLDEDPAKIELGAERHGKPVLADPPTPLRFNLSHSRDLAVVAVARGREVGVDVEWIDPRRGRPADFYATWTRREAVAKCLGVGLWATLPAAAVAVSPFDAEPGFAAAIAVAGEDVPPLRRFAIGADLTRPPGR